MTLSDERLTAHRAVGGPDPENIVWTGREPPLLDPGPIRLVAVLKDGSS